MTKGNSSLQANQRNLKNIFFMNSGAENFGKV